MITVQDLPELHASTFDIVRRSFSSSRGDSLKVAIPDHLRYNVDTKATVATRSSCEFRAVGRSVLDETPDGRVSFLIRSVTTSVQEQILDHPKSSIPHFYRRLRVTKRDELVVKPTEKRSPSVGVQWNMQSNTGFWQDVVAAPPHRLEGQNVASFLSALPPGSHHLHGYMYSSTLVL